MKNIFFWLVLLLLIIPVFAYSADLEIIEGNVTIDWKNQYEFEIIVGDTDREFDCRDVNSSHYNDFDRTWEFDYVTDIDNLRSCSEGQLNNITSTVSSLIDYCQNYQKYLNTTVSYADKYAEWYGAHQRCAEKLDSCDDERDDAVNQSNTLNAQMDACKRDKEEYLNDFRKADSDLAQCRTDLQDLEKSGPGKYIIGAVIGGIAVFLFTRKEGEVAQESEEFEEQDY